MSASSTPSPNSSPSPGFTPRLNHVAMSVDPAMMDEVGRKEILDFYGDVFGWTEGDNTGEKGNPLILYTGTFAQFVYLLPGDPFLTAPYLDHFGLQVATREELTDHVDRAKAYKKKDDRVRIIDIESRTTPGPTHDYTLTSAYIGFQIPLMVELQHLERSEHS
jgi:hypothetical protein